MQLIRALAPHPLGRAHPTLTSAQRVPASVMAAPVAVALALVMPAMAIVHGLGSQEEQISSAAAFCPRGCAARVVSGSEDGCHWFNRSYPNLYSTKQHFCQVIVMIKLISSMLDALALA